MKLSELNELHIAEAEAAFLKCCHCEHWASVMVERRPFESKKDLLETAEAEWWDLTAEHWLEAFSAHPKIGDIESLRKKYAASRGWSEGEQSGVDVASEEVLQGLAQKNKEYEEKHGFIFIVCATGKSAAEMLHILENRLENETDEELQNAATEQAKITELRLEKLLSE